jgi:integrase
LAIKSFGTSTAKLPRGITRSAKGWRLCVQVQGRQYRKRFPPSTSQQTVEAALLKARQRQPAGRQSQKPDTFAADVTRYLSDHYAGNAGLDERTRHLALWRSALGDDTRRDDITRDDVARVLNGWRQLGLAADTCNKRRTALLALYHALDGKGGSNPVRDIPKFRAPDPLPRGLAYSLIEKAFAKMPSCKTKARLQVLAYTGMRAGQLMKLKPEHWDHRRHVLTVPGTTKGRGTKPYVVPLSPQATAALKAFDTLEAWGVFTRAPMARRWRDAATKAKLPPDTVPYDLRHSFGTQVYRKTGNLKAAKDLLGHSSLRVTERYTLAAVPQHKIAAIKTAFGSAR